SQQSVSFCQIRTVPNVCQRGGDRGSPRGRAPGRCRWPGGLPGGVGRGHTPDVIVRPRPPPPFVPRPPQQVPPLGFEGTSAAERVGKWDAAYPVALFPGFSRRQTPVAVFQKGKTPYPVGVIHGSPAATEPRERSPTHVIRCPRAGQGLLPSPPGAAVQTDPPGLAGHGRGAPVSPPPPLLENPRRHGPGASRTRRDDLPTFTQPPLEDARLVHSIV